MSIVYTPLGHYVNVTGMGQCILDKMTELGIKHPERLCVPVPGEIAWDECTCGQLAITTQRIFPSRVFPVESVDDAEQSNCGPAYLVAQLVVSIIRCIPISSQNGNPPTCAALGTASLDMYKDANAVLRGVMCCVRTQRDAYNIAEFNIGATTFVGPEGQCAGSELTVLLGYTGVCCG